MSNLLNSSAGKAVKYGILTIFLGAIGSGCWDWILKPAANNFAYYFLNVVDFVFKSYKDYLYKEIAFGFHEELSIQLFAMLSMILQMPLWYSVLSLRSVIKKTISHKKNNNDTISEGHVKSILLLGEMICALLFVVFSINFTEAEYVNRAITYFNRLIVISRPYMNQDEVNIIQSKFALIRNRDDYKSLVEDLRNVCRNQHILYPEFKIW